MNHEFEEEGMQTPTIGRHVVLGRFIWPSRAWICSVFFLVAGAMALISPPAQAVVPGIPTVEGPITGPGPMHPGIRPGPDGTNPEDFNYIVDEYFVSGNAGPTGAPYKVRVLVRRPALPQKFSGIVVYEPTHRGGNALIFQFARFGNLTRGHAGVTVGARPINLNNPTTPGAGLHQFNIDRYGSLQVASDQTNEILAQVAWMLKSNHPNSPFGAAYPVKTIVMGGTSDSSGATRSYMGSAHNTAFRTPTNGPIIDGFFVSATLGSAPVEMTDVPTIQMPTQFELASTNAYRRPDSDVAPNLFRIFEVAGMSHNDSRDQPATVFPGCAEPLSRFPYGPMTFMGLQWVIDWAAFGKVPPHADYIEVNAGPPRSLVFDEFGNAKGGVRTPHLDVPIYRYVTPNTGPGLCSQTGRQLIFSDEVLLQLYPNNGTYVSKFNKRLGELERAGFWPKEYSNLYARDDIKDFTH
jgi:hypothetical protein